MLSLALTGQQSVTVSLDCTGTTNGTAAGHSIRERSVESPLDLVHAIQKRGTIWNIEIKFFEIRFWLFFRIEPFNSECCHQ
jgi:hypothetical protein